MSDIQELLLLLFVVICVAPNLIDRITGAVEEDNRLKNKNEK